jgi:hypothetical protein
LEEFKKAMQIANIPGGAAAVAEDVGDVGKSLKEVLEEREEQLKDIEQL